MILFSPLHVGRPLGFAPEAALEDLGFPLCRPGMEVVQLPGLAVPYIQVNWWLGQ